MKKITEESNYASDTRQNLSNKHFLDPSRSSFTVCIQRLWATLYCDDNEGGQHASREYDLPLKPLSILHIKPLSILQIWCNYIPKWHTSVENYCLDCSW